MENDTPRLLVLQDNINLAKRHAELNVSIANLDRGIVAEEVNLAKLKMSNCQFRMNIKKSRESLAIINREIADTHQKYIQLVRKNTNSHQDVLRELNELRYGEGCEVTPTWIEPKQEASTWTEPKQKASMDIPMASGMVPSPKDAETAIVSYVTKRNKNRNVKPTPNELVRPRRSVGRVNYKELSGQVKLRRQ